MRSGNGDAALRSSQYLTLASELGPNFLMHRLSTRRSKTGSHRCSLALPSSPTHPHQFRLTAGLTARTGWRRDARELSAYTC